MKWNKLEEEQFIKDYVSSNLSMKDLINKYKRTRGSLVHKAAKLGVKRFNISINDITLICNYYIDGLSINDIKSKTRFCREVINNILKNAGIKLRQRCYSNRTYTLYYEYFNSIDTADKAYWLGFLAADGYNLEKNNRVVLALADKDLNHLFKFKECIEFTGNLKSEKIGQHTLCLHSKQMSEDLARHGIVQAKTFKLQFPSLDNKFQNSFLLGYFDGDGSIKGTRGKACYFQVSGNLSFLEAYQSILIKNCNLNKPKIYKDKSIHRLIYSGRLNCLKIYNFLYKDSSKCFLDRKFFKFKELLASESFERLPYRLSAEGKANISKKLCKKVVVHGVLYNSLTEASKILDINITTLHDRLNSNKPTYEDYKYA